MSDPITNHTKNSGPPWSPRAVGLACTLLGIAVFLLQVWLFRPIWGDYFPTHDDIALVAESTDAGGPANVHSWLKDGYHYYFYSDAEWPWIHPSTDFVRPLSNSYQWASYRLFGTQWGHQLLVGYAAHAAAVAVVAYIALAIFGLSLPFAAIAVLAAALSPAYCGLYLNPYWIPWAIQFPVYQIEVLTGLLMLLAMVAFIRQRLVWFALLATVACLTKEPALTLPVAAFCIPALWLDKSRVKTLGNLCLIALPLAVWFGIRSFLFVHKSEVYVLPTANSPIASVARHLLLWPSAMDLGQLRDLVDALHTRKFSVVAEHSMKLGVNLLWWLAIAAAMWQVIRTAARRWLSEAPTPAAIALVFALGNLGLVVVIQNTDIRYGYFWFALAAPVLMAILAQTYKRVLIAVLLVAPLAVSQASSLRTALNADSLERYHFVKHAARQFSEVLAKLGPQVKTVYMADDTFMRDTTQAYTAKLAGFRGAIIRINEVIPTSICSASDAASHYDLRERDGTTELNYRQPSCLTKPKKAIEVPLGAVATDGTLQRGPNMSYSFPELTTRAIDGRPQYDFGTHWQFFAHDPGCKAEPASCVWLGLDPVSATYVTIPLQSN